jgi:hypothetical protein
MRTADDVQLLDNILRDTPTDGVTRRSLIQRAAVTAAAAGAAGALGPVAAFAQNDGDTPEKVLNVAITAEALAVTYLSGLLANNLIPKQFVGVVKAANASEYDHYKALKALGAKPLTTKFWAPNAFFEKDKVFATIEAAEDLFVNAYLVGATVFAKAGNADAARYAGEIGGVEAQHRALARFAQGKLPNNVGFEQYKLTTVDAHVKKLQSLGIGFGQKGSAPGKFYEFPGKPPHATVTKLSHASPT